MGPTFGNFELAASEPFDQNINSLSVANSYGNSIEKDSEGINMLTNLKCVDRFIKEFSISELEVWEVIFEK